MAGFFRYLYRVYIPKFSKHHKSYSTYSRSDEFWAQILMWAAIAATIAFIAYHLWTLVFCHSHFRHSVCYTLFYSWGAYAIGLGVAGTYGMLLHYAYVDPDQVVEDLGDNSEDDDDVDEDESMIDYHPDKTEDDVIKHD